MDVPRLSGPDQLVTADNPARTNLSGMDHDRCAALHNYLVSYAWAAEGRRLEGSDTFFTTNRAAAKAIRPRLHPSLAAFLDKACVPPMDADSPPLFFWVSCLSLPAQLIDTGLADLFDEPEDNLICLYGPNIGPVGAPGGGLFYHQG